VMLSNAMGMSSSLDSASRFNELIFMQVWRGGAAASL